MAKQFGKFSEEMQKLENKYKSLKESERSAISTRVKLAWAQCNQGEDYLQSELVKARKAGVSGTKPADFVKQKDVAEAMQLMGHAAKDLDEKVEAFDAFDKSCAAAVEAYTELNKKVAKDLQSRKDTSMSKNDIEALQGEIADRVHTFERLISANSNKVNKAMRGYSKTLTKTITNLIAEAPDAVQKKVEAFEEPQIFQDRNIKGATSKCTAGLKRLQAHCNTAIDKAGDGNKSGAAQELKLAMAEFTAIKQIADQYQEMRKKHSAMVDNADNKSKILDSIKIMLQSQEAGARLIRGVSTTIKKAG